MLGFTGVIAEMDGSQGGDTVTFLGPGTYFTMPYPKLTMITRRRASVLLIADINSAKISKPWAEGDEGKSFALGPSGRLPPRV